MLAGSLDTGEEGKGEGDLERSYMADSYVENPLKLPCLVTRGSCLSK